MKVAFYTQSFAGGGAERVFIRLANHFANEGIATSIVVSSADGPLRSLVAKNVQLVDLHSRHTRAAIPKLSAFLKTERPDALISALTFNNLGAVLAGLLSRTRSKIIVSERNHLSALLKHNSPLRAFAARKLVRLLYRRADAITAVSAGVADDLALVLGVSRGEIHVIENPPPDAGDIASAKQASSPHPWFGEGAPVAIAIGRLTPQKNYELLLGAIAKLSAGGREIRLIVLGEGPQREELEARAKELGIAGHVYFAGFVMNRLDYLVRSSVYALSSATEGHPNALVEAVACGIPVVSTDCAGNGPRELLGRDHPAALVPMNDVDRFATAMLREIDTPVSPDVLARMAAQLSLASTARRFLSLAR